MQFPKISIVTPSYNQGNYLEKTILSVIGQQYPNLEYIIIDGGSTDNSVEIIRKYEKELTYWISEKDNGMYEAVQKGFDKCTGDIMAWINSDDWYYPKSFFVVAEIFSNYQNVEWLQGLPSIIDEEDRIVSVLDFRKWSKYDFLAGEYKFIQQESCFWRSGLWKKAGGKLNTGLKYAGDFALWLNFFSHAELYCMTTVLGGFRVRGKNQISLEKIDDYIMEANYLLKIRQDNLLAGEWMNVLGFSFHYKFMRLIPLLSSIYSKLYIKRKYPPKIDYSRKLQKFIMK